MAAQGRRGKQGAMKVNFNLLSKREYDIYENDDISRMGKSLDVQYNYVQGVSLRLPLKKRRFSSWQV